MVDSGTSTSTNPNKKVLSISNNSNKTFSFKPHSDMSDSYNVILPEAIGTADQVLKISSVDGSRATCEWGAGGESDTNTTYTQTWQDSGDNAILRLTAGGSGSGNDDLTLVAGDNITLTPSGDNLTIASSGGGGGGSGIVNNRIDGDLTIGEDDSEILTIASKINVNGNEKTLLNKPVAADKGKIVTVNAAGDDLEYGANFRELACNQTIVTNSFEITSDTVDRDRWVDLASHTTSDSINTSMNTEVTINVSQNSKVEVKAQIELGQDSGSTMTHAIRLGKKVGNSIIWGTSGTGITTTLNDDQTDPKGDVVGTSVEAWRYEYSFDSNNYRTHSFTASYIDEDPTNGLTGYNNVTYFIRIYHPHTDGDIWIGRPNLLDSVTRGVSPTILSAVEIGSGAITSFTQEQALAGAGGTASFTNTYKDGDNDTDLSGSDDPRLAFNNTLNSSLNSGFWHNDPYDVGDLADQLPLEIGVNFSSPQIVTTYRIWSRVNKAEEQAPKAWQIRAAIDKATYDSGTYTTLDSRTNVTSFPTTSTSTPSDNLDKANEYNLSTIGAYQYYVFYFTESNDVRYMSIGELALYGGGFTIPSQIGNGGKQLITNGTSLSWGSPASILVPSPTGNANKVLQANSAGNALEYSNTINSNQYNVNQVPLITQVHSFIQTDINNTNQSIFFSHAPNYDGDINNFTYGMKSVVNMIPYAISIGTDVDTDSQTDFTFQIRARTDTSNIANITTSDTTVRGTVTINNLEENDTQMGLFTGATQISVNQSWGLYLSSMSPDGYAGEIVTKVYFYQA